LDGEVIERVSRRVGVRTNNEAEYLALLAALRKALAMNAREVELVSDSELLVKQVRGEYKVKSPRLRRLHREVIKLVSKIPSVRIIHVDRGRNKEADKLAKKAAEHAKDS